MKRVNYNAGLSNAVEANDIIEEEKWSYMDLRDMIRILKNYIHEYRGTTVFEDFAEYIGEDVADIIDIISDIESRGGVHISDRIQRDDPNAFISGPDDWM